MHRFFGSDFFNFEFIRLLSTAPNGGCEIGEALASVSRIKDNDPESWSREWASCSERAEALADEASASGDMVAARGAYLRATNYARASQFMMSDRPNAPEPRLLPRAERYVTLFKKASGFLDEAELEFLNIPYEADKELPAILYLPRDNFRLKGCKIPIVVNVNGGDSIQEELFFVTPSAGPRLGYAVLTFDGPGQGMALRRDRLSMRPDYEFVTGKVLDFLWQYSKEHPELELDLERVAVVGATLGGYNALRAAVDPRFKACVSIDPVYDLWELAIMRMPKWFINGWLSGWIKDSFVNGMISLLSTLNFQFKWEVNHMMWAFGCDQPAKALLDLRSFSLQGKDGKFLHKIHCPVLVSGAAAAIYFKPEMSTTRIYEELIHLNDSQKKSWIAKETEGGGLQAKLDAQNQLRGFTSATIKLNQQIMAPVRETVLKLTSMRYKNDKVTEKEFHDYGTKEHAPKAAIIQARHGALKVAQCDPAGKSTTTMSKSRYGVATRIK
ncbi:hypothetical protein G7Y89_g8973 [Cudoniella acicularis]|uniref:Alpha/beta hydrolase n=1 Tax=Cudoniella acicularis TaxID=354080 RepID=A0A8H4RH45_9HELO|nr:hypothetical protein G7Y89_g8973 [Cudoniella acicularis]